MSGEMETPTMPHRPPTDSAYFECTARRNWITWGISGMAAVGLNLALFLLMPRLLDPTPPRRTFDTVVDRVHIVRVRKPDTPAVSKPIRPPEPRPAETQARPAAPSPNRPVDIERKLTLPFEINPRLPSGPTPLDLPPLESAPPVDVGGLPDAFSVGDLDGPMTVLNRIAPVYPLRAKRRGIEGWVRVKFLVNEAGAVSSLTILEAEPSGLFEQSVERSVSRWRFNPGTVGGIPVRTWVETTVRFELEG